MNLGLPFEDALADLRISGCVLLHENYAPPWAIDVPAEDELQAIMNVGRNVRVVPFHLARRGGFEMVLGKTDRLDVQTHDVAICPGGARHRMQFGAAVQAVPLAEILAGARMAATNGGATGVTELICGVFLFRAVPLNPLLSALPPALKVSTVTAGGNAMLTHAAEMLALEVRRSDSPAGSFTAARLLEIFCAEILRACQSELAESEAGWLRGLADAKVAKALSLIHGAPEAQWSVAALANAVALSPSRFAARFRDTMGETAMAYLARWRMVRACRLLENTEDSIEIVAAETGYSAASSFSRAFKSSLGMNPIVWRRINRKEADGRAQG